MLLPTLDAVRATSKRRSVRSQAQYQTKGSVWSNASRRKEPSSYPPSFPTPTFRTKTQNLISSKASPTTTQDRSTQLKPLSNSTFVFIFVCIYVCMIRSPASPKRWCYAQSPPNTFPLSFGVGSVGIFVESRCCMGFEISGPDRWRGWVLIEVWSGLWGPVVELWKGWGEMCLNVSRVSDESFRIDKKALR